MNQTRTAPSPFGKLYLGAVACVGIGIIGHSLWWLCNRPPGLEWFILAALTLLTGSFTVKVPSLTARISVSETFVFTSALLFGPEAGTLTVVLDALIISFWLRSSSRSPTQFLFNLTAPAVAMWLSSVTFFTLAEISPGSVRSAQLAQLTLPMFVFAWMYFLINTGLVAGAIAYEKQDSPFRIWAHNFPAVSITYFVGASIAMLLVAYTPRINFTVLSIIIPLLLISYLTFRTSMGRLEDATRHVAQLNDLYMSTIEALAMAVDAKDQITHGHIRRVQVYAVELAKRLGVSDEQQLKAIEAAALLHDMGKLAIPEHILNKPGKLSPGEFEKMKRHANIGADLLSSIPFPYPVVPIVRHHHENWDGSGYPNRVAGTDIPFGARILAVVDCFDALTSDRPYRPRLSPEAAFQILRERRSAMYDPLVVDTFLEAYNEIAPAAIKAGESARSLVPISTTDRAGSDALAAIRATSLEIASLNEARRLASRAGTAAEVLEALWHAVQQHTPAAVVALYVYVPQHDSLRCIHALGDADGLLTGLEIPSGARTTGWAAANRQTITNSTAVLDLGHRAENFRPPLITALATPIITAAGHLAGVLTLYSTLESPYNQRHESIAEQLATVVCEHPACGSERQGASVVRFPDALRSSTTR